MAKNEKLREMRKQWFAPMEQKLQEMHTKEDDSYGLMKMVESVMEGMYLKGF